MFKKPNLAEIVRRQTTYIKNIESAQRDLDELNKVADSLRDQHYEIAQRAHLAAYIDENKLGYRELTGLDYNTRGKQ